MPKISIIVIGDELLIGQVVDTNSGEIARAIAPAGWELDRVVTVHDDAAQMRQAIAEALSQSDIVLTTGGLGPTKDDITKRVLLDIFGGELREDAEVLRNVKEVVRKRGIQLNDLTAAQALVPTSCRPIQNEVGTAPLMWFERDGKVLVAMPGVPFETKHMFHKAVLPMLLKRFASDQAIGHRTVVVANRTESAIAGDLELFENSLPPFLHLAYLPKPGIVRLRLDGIHRDAALLSEVLNERHRWLVGHFGQDTLTDRDLTPEEVLIEELRNRRLTVATAESCTGGNIAHRITMIAGCSDVMMGGVVSYANSVKTNQLGVDPRAIEEHGAVSETVARQMAEGAIKHLGANCAMATSGIAGPSGAVPGKPVGTVCIAAAIGQADGVVCSVATHHFPGDRSRVIDRASTAAILSLISLLRQHP